MNINGIRYYADLARRKRDNLPDQIRYLKGLEAVFLRGSKSPVTPEERAGFVKMATSVRKAIAYLEEQTAKENQPMNRKFMVTGHHRDSAHNMRLILTENEGDGPYQLYTSTFGGKSMSCVTDGKLGAMGRVESTPEGALCRYFYSQGYVDVEVQEVPHETGLLDRMPPAKSLPDGLSHVQVESALCLWEAMLETRRESPDVLPLEWLDKAFDDMGTVHMRHVAIAAAPFLDATWKAMPDDFQQAAIPFDWAFVPNFLHAIDPEWIDDSGPYFCPTITAETMAEKMCGTIARQTLLDWKKANPLPRDGNPFRLIPGLAHHLAYITEDGYLLCNGALLSDSKQMAVARAIWEIPKFI